MRKALSKLTVKPSAKGPGIRGADDKKHARKEHAAHAVGSYKRKSISAAKSSGGVVRIYVHGSTGKDKGITVSKLIESLQTGLPVEELDELQSQLDVPIEKLAPMLGISKATLHRRKTAGKLDLAESDRVVRFARLLGKAASVMESIERGRRWLMSPQVGLGGAVPLEYAETEVGTREVENLLGRIEYGVYS